MRVAASRLLFVLLARFSTWDTDAAPQSRTFATVNRYVLLITKILLDMKKLILYIAIGGFALILVIPFFTYIFPNSEFAKLLKHYSDNSSFIIAFLTFAYVLTSMFQLFNMKSQLSMMDKNMKLQIQPLPVPSIIKFEIEKMRPYCGPEDNFTTIKIMHRIHSIISIRNNGNGIPINIHIFPTLILNNGIEIPQPCIAPEKISILTEGKQSNNIKIFFFDDNYKIIEQLSKNQKIKLKLEIVYKNIFNSGFYSNYLFILEPNEKSHLLINDSFEFVKNDLPTYKVEQEKHRVIKPLDQSEAEKILDKINNSILQKFNENIILLAPEESIECNIEIVNFETKLKSLIEKYKILVDNNYKKLSELFEKINIEN
jgi:hypothetical protein